MPEGNFLTQVYHRITDTNVFYTDAGFSYSALNNKLKFSEAHYDTKPPFIKKYKELASLFDKFGTCKNDIHFMDISPSLIGILCVVFLFIFILQKKENGQINY